MATALFIIKAVNTGPGWAPKYLPARLNPGGTLSGLDGCAWSWQFLALRPVGVVEVTGTQTQLDLLAAQADAILVPPLDNTIGAAGVTRVKNFLEAAGFPAGWVQTGQTYRFILRTICHVFYYWSRVTATIGQTLEQAGFDIDATYGTLPQAWQDEIVTAAVSLGLNTAGLNATTTVRTIMKSVAQQLDSKHVVIGSTQI